MSASGRARLKLAVGAVVVAAIALAVVEGLHWWRHVTVTSSWIDADFTVMGSGVNGRIQRIEVRKGDAVAAGDLLATMDAEIAEIDLAALKADLATAEAERERVVAELAAFRRDVADRTETLNAVLRLQAREGAALGQRLEIAEKTVARNAKLIRRQTISQQTDDLARDRLLDVTSDIRELETEMAERRRKISELEGARTQEAIFLSRIAVIDRQIDKLGVTARRAERELEKMHIYAPIDAVVNEIYVNAGAYVEDGDRVFLLHDPKALWIEAPVDEAEIRLVAVGQPVEVDVDAYPYDTFWGTVRAVGQVTIGALAREGGSERTSPQVPVVVALEPSELTLWPGVRATVKIRVR